MKSNRRKFFSLFGLGMAGTVLSGAKALASMDQEGAPDDREWGGISISTTQVKAELNVGKDGRLWLKQSGGPWRPVATE